MFAIGLVIYNFSKYWSYDVLLDDLNGNQDGDVNPEYVAYEMLGLKHLVIPLLIIIFKQ